MSVIVNHPKTAIRGALLTFKKDPFFHPMAECFWYESDAIIVMENGKISVVGKADDILPTLGDISVKHYRDSLMMPGFIDSHVHYPQTQIIGAYGEQLIDWLNNYTFIAEQNFKDRAHADEVAEVFLREQRRNGVTASTIFCTVFPESVDAIFAEAEKYNMRIMAGKVCMDRYAPEALLDTPQKAYDESKALIEKWHKRGRAEYVITPRFAPTSTHEQLEMIGTLASEFPDTLIQSHVSENIKEIEWVKELFPKAKDYTDVYDQYGLLRDRAIYGHGVHLTEREFHILNERGSAVAHCPTSNFFLGSGAFNVHQAKSAHRPIKVGLATDLGAGTSFSILQTMNEAYKAAQLNGAPYSSLHTFYLATKGTAEALSLEDKIGALEVGMEADLVVLNLKSTPIIEYRMRYAQSLEETLFIQMTLGDDRAIAATYIAGKMVYEG
ncbi:guanine deaminase [Ignatzschineria rhizosphaerae]|uniref:Guanine deaminase n=1 Tax=Ignatzschineria rhizosphaerae TaxID=2923279 RepID=A0ABY3X5A4_9GAMM|nr:guanine deaminase [Ignatzschineria rhizosphaerae]UNM96232.1 guanine deaminase [Ignatzschineria rhizosphaerae]